MISIEIGADFSITEGEKAFEQKVSKGLILNFERAPTAAHLVECYAHKGRSNDRKQFGTLNTDPFFVSFVQYSFCFASICRHARKRELFQEPRTVPQGKPDPLSVSLFPSVQILLFASGCR